MLKNLIEVIGDNSKGFPIIFPVHPRTRQILNRLEIAIDHLHLVDPLGYLEFNYLVSNALGVLTDSGGITEEATVMNIPCITLRDTTERPETCEIGTNVLVGNDHDLLKQKLKAMVENNWKQGQIPILWDGQAATRIVNHLIEIFNL